ncbi:hypothetical protein [Roseovarius sp. D22-M7]|uniref:hypothetical protein n=1 Tax=Roseovarius sp. D22-M7 TaxID=3127116 RepID=UPI00300F8C42
MRNAYKGLGLTAAIAMAGLFAGAASAAVIDFDALDATAGQTVPLTSFSEDGYTFDLSFTGGSAGPAVFDTTCTGYGGTDGCNDDADLQPTVQGENGVSDNVLILQRSAPGALIPNDFNDGGRIGFTLTSGKAFFLTGFSAVDDEMFSAIDTDGSTVLGSITLGSDGETGTISFRSSRIEIGDTFYFDYAGSGGIDSLTTTPVPVPAALPLALSAFGALAWLGRRRRRPV